MCVQQGTPLVRGPSKHTAGGRERAQKGSDRHQRQRKGVRKVGSINILLARVNRNTKDNAFSRTSFNCSVYIKLEEKLCCDITVTFHFIILKYFITIIRLYRVFT